MSLRRTVATLTIVVTVIAVLIAIALVVLTTALHRTTAGAVESVESVRYALRAQIELVHHQRGDLLNKRASEGEIHRRLDAAEHFVSTDRERELLDRSRELVDAYFALSHGPLPSDEEELDNAHVAAFGALEELATYNVAESKAHQQEAARWNELANVIAIAATLLLVLLAGLLLIWLKGRAFKPIFELAATMERFGRGDHDARAAEHGPRELREMCRRFNEMASAIVHQRRSRTVFLGGVAHDLRTPLSALQMSVVLLLRDSEVADHEGLRLALERIGRQVKRMDRMLGDFLDGAKIEAGVLELRIEVHDARAIVAEVVELFDGLSDHRLDVRLPAAAVPICCDQLRIEQVLANLISNAIKYSPAQGVIEIELRSGAKEIDIVVADHGVGISEQTLNTLFQPFARGGLSSEMVPGVGLGLFVVRRIVEAHGGRITVESEPGRGSTFKVTLPLQCQS